MVFTLVFSQAQTVEIPLSEKVNLKYLRDTLIIIGTIPSNSGQIDNVGYLTSVYPTMISDNGFATMKQIDGLFESRSYRNKTVFNGLTYVPNRTKYFAALRNRKGIALIQKVGIYEPEFTERSNPQKFWYLFEYMIENNIPLETFWNHPQVDSIVNPQILIETDSIN